MERIKLADISFPEGYEGIEQIVFGYQRYQVLISAMKFGLFDLLERKNGAVREEITSLLSLNGMLTRSYLRCLVQMGLLEEEEDRYYNSEKARQFLIPTSPVYQGDLINQIHDPSSRWNHLYQALQADNPNLSSGPSPGPSSGFLRGLSQRTMHGELQTLIKTVTNLPSFSSFSKMLDIGGGHGLHSIGICQMNENLHATILDQPQVIGLAPEFITRYGMSERITVRQGDICTMELFPEYDLILVSHLLYKFRDQLPSIFSRITKGLKTGGVFVSNHWFCGSGCIPSQDATMELERSMQSAGHPLCHEEVFEELFASNGLKVIHSGMIPGAYGGPVIHIGQRT